ncbi:MAG: HAMP domain-containing sensor histidine kinase [Patescibacteria group bacterium]
MSTELLVSNIGHTISIITTLIFAILVLSRGYTKTTHVIFFLMGIATIVWELSYIIGGNIIDPHLSRFAFMWNIASLWAIVFNTHLVLLVTKQYEVQKILLRIIYATVTGLTIFFVALPDFFLLPSEPRAYFINFFVEGKYYFVGDIFFFATLLYALCVLIYSHKHGDFEMKNRLKYLGTAMAIAYGIGSIPLFLLYGIEINPLFSALIGLYMIPLAYSVVEYKLVDINIIAKRAFWYGLGVAGVALTITLISSANETIISLVPNFPPWIIPTLSGIIAVSCAIFVWKKIREVDILKDEFMNIIMHKFRTPLTGIKWSVENLKSSSITPEQKKELENIESEGVALVGLTDIMANLADVGNGENTQSLSEDSLARIVDKTLGSRKNRLDAKNIEVKTRYEESLPSINVDAGRIEFIVETLVDNALAYTPQGGLIEISILRTEDFLTCSVHDNGIGISKEDMPRLFNKFFRGAGTATHTEGMGIGLFISKEIIKRHGGKIWAESEGLNKGAMFSFTLPVKH